jgi:hypothetical protein
LASSSKVDCFRSFKRSATTSFAENLEEEAKLSMTEIDFNQWKNWKKVPSVGDLPVDRRPKIDASYDMAWQQKGSGHVYNSQSGHGTLFGRRTRKIIGLVIKSKLCYYCSAFAKKNPGIGRTTKGPPAVWTQVGLLKLLSKLSIKGRL